MSICGPLAAEMQQEAKTTRRLLERVPEGSFAWKPHEKSMSLGRLAAHVAELPELIIPALKRDELDFASGDFKPFEPKSNAELLEKFDRNIAANNTFGVTGSSHTGLENPADPNSTALVPLGTSPRSSGS